MRKNQRLVKPFSWFIEKTELAYLLHTCELRVEKVEKSPSLPPNPAMIEPLAFVVFPPK
jgi:hypothetical protein